ncbi:S41 family peptidase [Caulobacter radicis]|nr:S41 family peptidase [Caulobacter radicis]
MRSLAPLFILAVGLMAAWQAKSAEVAPRPVVDGVAQAIADNYYDAAKGAAVAAELRAEAAKGTYDRLTDPRDLATTLSERLRPLDHHFNVSWSAEPPQAPRPAPGPSAAAVPGPQRVDPIKRANYGIRRVEILNGNLGYIDMRMFAHFEFGDPDAPARKAIEAALQLVAGADAVIIDLRDNGGGSPAMVGYLASAFTPRGADIYNTFKYREGTESEAPKDWYPAPRLETPLYVLISGRTGSAAEALAYTLKNAKRAVIVGEASGGAANPGGPVPVTGGFSIFVSNGSPVSPITKTNWEGDGVQPDVAVPAAKALDTARGLALEAVLKTAAGPAAQDARWALETLRAEAAPPAAGPLADYVGAYGAVEIVQVDGRLAMKRGRRPLTVLLPLGGETFTVAGESGRRVVFERDAKGAVSALEAVGYEGGGSRFRRGATPGA